MVSFPHSPSLTPNFLTSRMTFFFLPPQLRGHMLPSFCGSDERRSSRGPFFTSRCFEVLTFVFPLFQQNGYGPFPSNRWATPTCSPLRSCLLVPLRSETLSPFFSLFRREKVVSFSPIGFEREVYPSSFTFTYFLPGVVQVHFHLLVGVVRQRMRAP